jgi:predicted methyltransferase
MRRLGAIGIAILALSLGCSNTTVPAQTEGSRAQAEDARPAATAPAPAADETAPNPADTRPEEDVMRDADRKPREVLEFFGIAEGMQAVDLMAGRGYYSHVIAQVVGPTGKVWAHNSPFVLNRFAEKPISERLALPGMEHVERLDTELDDPKLPSDIDAVTIVLFYHDTYWQGVDREQMNAAIFAALKPGGIYGVVDHYAEDGSGDRDVKSLHRVDAELVKKEILAAGFEWVGESDLLRRPNDERTINVFTPEIRGKSDRFVFKFRKPS